MFASLKNPVFNVEGPGDLLTTKIWEIREPIADVFSTNTMRPPVKASLANPFTIRRDGKGTDRILWNERRQFQDIQKKGKEPTNPCPKNSRSCRVCSPYWTVRSTVDPRLANRNRTCRAEFRGMGFVGRRWLDFSSPSKGKDLTESGEFDCVRWNLSH